MADQPAIEVESIRRSLRGGLPFGEPAWVEEMAGKLGPEARTPARRVAPGRRKASPDP